MRNVLKRAAHASGLLGSFHRRQNADTLTVVTFHRVLDDGDVRWSSADPWYTVSSDFLRDCIDFFDDHYELVDGPAVAQACRGDGQLPEHALLVTFDDGWADTAECALPVLRELECPAVVFVPPPVVGATLPFWQERVFGAWQLGAVDTGELERAWADAGNRTPPPGDWSEQSSVRSLIRRLGQLDPAARSPLVEPFTAAAPPARPEMITLEQLRELHAAGLEIGAHGLTHEPLAGKADSADEIRQSRVQLSELLGGEPVTSMSFPHGSYDDAALAVAREEYEVVHTIVTTLNPTDDGHLASPVLGRIGISARELADDDGRLRPELLALWLFRRPIGPV
jgi:peptidoglycan/xylan/chitin deacetylase (PgdA/CDA1 family)